jgi:hypothetical protein
LTADDSVFQYSNANDMRVTQDLNSFEEIIAHAHCSVALPFFLDFLIAIDPSKIISYNGFSGC